MDKQTYSIDKKDKILVKAYGNLVISAWENAELGVKAGRNELKLVREENNVTVSAMGNCEIWLPADVETLIEKVSGRATIQGLTASAQINRVGGDLTLENVGPVIVEKVGGRFAARKLASLSLDKVGGRCIIEDVTGALQINKVGGDCFAKGISEVSINKVGGDINLQCTILSGSMTAGGDIHTSFDSIAGSNASLKAGGDVKLHLPAGTPFNLEIKSTAEDIRIKLAGQELRIEEESYSHQMGEGLPILNIMADGDVWVSDEVWVPEDFGDSFDSNEIGIDWDFSGFGDSIARTVEAAVSSSTRFADLGAHFGEKAARKGEAAARKAEVKIEKMMRAMDIEMRSSDPKWSAPQPPSAPEPPARSGISEEERMAVLRMLQEKKISLDEAERLLDALESFSE